MTAAATLKARVAIPRSKLPSGRPGGVSVEHARSAASMNDVDSDENRYTMAVDERP
jgi:hypothetical protein